MQFCYEVQWINRIYFVLFFFVAQCPSQDRNTLIESIRNWIFSGVERISTDISVSSHDCGRFVTRAVKV